MSLLVVRPGLFSTVQDLGRTGYRGLGVSPGGAFDRGSASLANALVGNDAGSAVIELTLLGGVFEAQAPLAVALAGAPMEAGIRTHDGRERTLRLPVAFSLDEGDRLALGPTSSGARTYLAVLGGLRTDPVLGSRSSETPLRPGEVLPCGSGWSPVRHLSPVEDGLEATVPRLLRVVAGPDSEARAVDQLISGRFHVGPGSDRMGLRLEGVPLEVGANPNRTSTPVAPGAVQVAGGCLLVLGVACGTMGGYAHVAHVISADLDRLGQTRPGDPVHFRQVALADARQLDRLARVARSARLARISAASADTPLRPVPGSPSRRFISIDRTR